MFTTRCFLTFAILALVIVTESVCGTDRGIPTAVFEPLGMLDDRSSPRGSQATGISADGTMIVGTSFIEINKNTETRAFVWSEATRAMVTFEPPANALSSTMANGISADGSVIAGGMGFVAAPMFEIRNGVAWVNSTPISLAGANVSYIGEDVADDGSVVIGVTRIPGPFPEPAQAFRWTPARGLEELGVMPGGFYTWGIATSADGSVVVGHGDFNGTLTAFRWTQTDSLNPIIDTGGALSSQVGGLSPDGTIIVGRFDREAMYWTAERGIVTLGELPNDAWCLGMDIAADGSVIVGACLGSGPGVPFIWTPQQGLRDFTEFLTTDHNIDLTGWTLQRATAISDDGRTIAGYGINPDGDIEGWRVILPARIASDITGDGVVNVFDLLDLLAMWGPCPAICAQDIVVDGDINVFDLLELLASWTVD